MNANRQQSASKSPSHSMKVNELHAVNGALHSLEADGSDGDFRRSEGLDRLCAKDLRTFASWAAESRFPSWPRIWLAKCHKNPAARHLSPDGAVEDLRISQKFSQLLSAIG